MVLNKLPVTLFVGATGTAPLSYQWFKGAQPIPGATNDTLTFAAGSPADAGTYSVTVTNVAGSASSQPATLTVLVPPAITTQPASQSVLNQLPVTLFVAATGTAPLSYQWFKDAQPIPGATQDTLTFSAVSPADAGMYSVTVTNVAGSAPSQPATLTVLGPPTLIIQPTNQTVRLGLPVTLKVSASGTPPLSYQWFKGGTAIAGATSDSLLLSAVTLDDAVTYDVTVSDAAGSAQSSPAQVSVWAPAQILRDDASERLRIRYVATGRVRIRVESAETLEGAWQPWPEPIPPATGVVTLELNVSAGPQRFVRVLVE